MKTILCIAIGTAFIFSSYGQCNKIVIPETPEGYKIISSMGINMKSNETKVKYAPQFLLNSNYEYKIQIINAEGYATNAEAQLFDIDDNKLIGTNFAHSQNKVFNDYSFKCQKTKTYKIQVSKINEGEEYCGKLLLMVKADNAETKSSTKPLSFDPSIFILVEKMPQFKNGDKSGNPEFVRWINQHEKVKQTVKETGQTGKIYVNFILDKEGYVNDVKIVRSNNKALNATAIEIVESSPKWYSPGYQKGEPKNIQFFFYIDFKKEYLN